MSYSFTITSGVAATPRTLFRVAGMENAAFRENVDLDVAWPAGVHHLYQPQESCRCIEAMSSKDEFNVRIMTHSSSDDYRLALRLIQTVATETDSIIHSEAGDAVDSNSFSEQFDDAWIEDMTQAAACMFNMLLSHGGTATIEGVRRPFTVGPELLSEFGFRDDRRVFSDRLSAAFSQVQWIDLDNCFEASVMVVAPSGSSEQRRISAIGTLGLKYLLRKVDFITAKAHGQLVLLPWHRLTDVFAERFQRLDEYLATIDPLNGPEWEAMADRLLLFSEPLT